MSTFVTLAQIDEQIAAIRANISDLTEQAAARSGANDDEHAQNAGDLIAKNLLETAKTLRLHRYAAKCIKRNEFFLIPI